MEIIDTKTLYTIGHLIGVALGAGGAFVSDAMFIKSARDKRFSRTEIGFLKLGSTLVWIGVAVLIGSGAALFSLDPAGYMASSKFLTKITIVGIIILNGLVFHFWHLPLIDRHKDIHFATSDEFVRKRVWVLMSGGISGFSWTVAIVLGALRGLPYSYGTLMLIYLVGLAFAVGTAVALRDKILPRHHRLL